MEENTNYPYQMFAELISYDVNPEKLDSALTPNQVTNYFKTIENEKINVEKKINEIIYKIKKKDHVSSTVKKLHDGLVVLIDKTYVNTTHVDAGKTNTRAVNEKLLEVKQELISKIKNDFPHYVGENVRIPVTELIEIRDDLQRKIPVLEKKLSEAKNDERLCEIVISIFKIFIRKIDDKAPIYEKELNYHLRVAKNIEFDSDYVAIDATCPSLHELLIHWNLNSVGCVKYFSAGMQQRIDALTTLEGKLEFVEANLKKLHSIPQIEERYDERYEGFKEHFDGILVREKALLERKIAGFKPISETVKDSSSKLKVMVMMSIDQISLVLRAMTMIGVIKAKSLSIVYKMLMPFLSTEAKENLSWVSAKNKSYTGEERDKRITIEILESIKQGVEAL
uniref:hypothetical protein n=1 Tax=Pedobacter schmidteae TaxID=2201271 RepID=UPI000EB16EB2|nr:hypothetical protein [Pedobacter schmidteae]